MRVLLLVSVLLLLGAPVDVTPSARAGSQGGDGPRLLVILVVDQMRADYVSRMTPAWSRGLKRMVTEGAVLVLQAARKPTDVAAVHRWHRAPDRVPDLACSAGHGRTSGSR